MIPREILKKIRQIELLTNRIVTEAVGSAHFLVSAGRHRVLDAENKALGQFPSVFEPKTDVRLLLSHVVVTPNDVALHQNYTPFPLSHVHLVLWHVASRLMDVFLLPKYVAAKLRDVLWARTDLPLLPSYIAEALNHVGLLPGYIPDSQRNILWHQWWVALLADNITGRLNSARFAPDIPAFSFV